MTRDSCVSYRIRDERHKATENLSCTHAERQETKMTTIVLADDSGLARSGTASYIEAAKGFELVGEADDGEKALALIRELKPDIALIDIRMPKKSGIEVAQEVKNERLRTKVVILTAHPEGNIKAARNAGVRGFLTKDVSLTEFVNTLNIIAHGGKYTDQSLDEPEESDAYYEELTNAQRNVLLHSAAGMRVKDIADKLHITISTVQSHRTAIYGKLGLPESNRNIAAATSFALANGIISQAELDKVKAELDNLRNEDS